MHMAKSAQDAAQALSAVRWKGCADSQMARRVTGATSTVTVVLAPRGAAALATRGSAALATLGSAAKAVATKGLWECGA